MHVIRREIARTPFGEPSGPLVFGEMNDIPMLFIARHGPGHILLGAPPPQSANPSSRLAFTVPCKDHVWRRLLKLPAWLVTGRRWLA